MSAIAWNTVYPCMFRPPLTAKKQENGHLKNAPRPALRGGVRWQVGALRPPALSCTIFVPSVHPLILASGRSRYLRHTAPHTALCGAGVSVPAHAAIAAHSGPQAVTCRPGPLSSADAPQRAPADPVAGRSVHLSPPGSDGACTAGSHCVSDQPWW